MLVSKQMNKIKPVFLALALVSANAHAGFFDFLKSDQDKAPTVAAEPAAAAPTSASSSTMGDLSSTGLSLATSLIPQLTNTLSISEEQATGGLGSIMQYAKSSLSSEQGQQLASGIPGFDALLAAAPALSGASGLSGTLGQIGALGGSLGSAANAAGGLDLLTQQFGALGLSPDMIGQIAQMAMQFFASNDPATGSLLDQALGALI
jgi:uncharacterized protein VcgC/VcgE DUF2780